MTTIEQIKSTLENIRADLKREKEELITLLKDPRIADWQGIDLKKNMTLLASIGIDPAVINTTLAEYPQLAKKIGKQIADWHNEVGNQLADLIGQFDPDAALAAARRLEERCRGLAAMKAELQTCTTRLIMADQVLRQQLNLKPMLAIAKLLVTSKREFFDGGTATLSLIDADLSEKGGVIPLSEMIQEPSRIEARFQRLDVTKLPRIVEEILFSYIDDAIAASKEIGIFLNTVNERMARELQSISTIKRDLDALNAENPAALLNGIILQASVVANLISALYHKRQIKDTIATVNEALEVLNVFHLLLKNRLIPILQKEVEAPGSVLNPITIASRMTKSFFMGATGIIRSLKLMMTSLTGQAAINEIELQLTLEKGIANCKAFYGRSPDDLKKIKFYIDSLVGHYQKPFPYNDLYKLIKTTLAAYGDEVEKFIQGYSIPKDILTMTTADIPAKTGKLTAAIIKHKNTFQKANSDL